VVRAYDLLTGTQLCIAFIYVAMAFLFQKRQEFHILFLFGMPIMYICWGSVLIYHFSYFLYLTLLWMLLGFLLGIVISVYKRNWFSQLYYIQSKHVISCHKATVLTGYFLISALAAGILQLFLYNYPDYMYNWNFNEGMGLMIGIFMGLCWGSAGVMLLNVQWVDEFHEDCSFTSSS